MDSIFHENLWNIIFGRCINFDLIKSFWNVVTTLFVSGELLSRCYTETKSLTPKQALRVRGGCGSTWVGVWIWDPLFPAAPLAFRHSGTAAWEIKMFENICPHLCELIQVVPQHPSWDIVWACCFLGVDVLLTSSADAVRGRWPVMFPAIPRSLYLPSAPLSSDLITAPGFESWSSCEKLYHTAFLC